MAKIKTITVSINRMPPSDGMPREHVNVLDVEVRTNKQHHHIQRIVHHDDFKSFFDQTMEEVCRVLRDHISKEGTAV